MKRTSCKQRILCIFIFLYWHLSFSSSLYSGSWCPYQVEKLIPCRVKNGTESYYGPNICWKSVNGSYSCTKKILRRQKFVTTYKKVMETMYKCCPGLEGSECIIECFNCSSYKEMTDRLDKLESRVSRIFIEPGSDLIASQSFGNEDIHHENLLPSGEHHFDSSLTFIALNTRLSSIKDEYREMESRIRSLESEVFRLTSTLEDLTRTVNNVRDNHISEPLIRNQNYPRRHTSKNLEPTSTAISTTTNQLHGVKSVDRPLEDNLDRGDIASTLNDDYGEEILFDNSTEQYIDPIHKDYSGQ